MSRVKLWYVVRPESINMELVVVFSKRKVLEHWTVSRYSDVRQPQVTRHKYHQERDWVLLPDPIGRICRIAVRLFRHKEVTSRNISRMVSRRSRSPMRGGCSGWKLVRCHAHSPVPEQKGQEKRYSTK